jgi:hypothetical protein
MKFIFNLYWFIFILLLKMTTGVINVIINEKNLLFYLDRKFLVEKLLLAAFLL